MKCKIKNFQQVSINWTSSTINLKDDLRILQMSKPSECPTIRTWWIALIRGTCLGRAFHLNSGFKIGPSVIQSEVTLLRFREKFFRLKVGIRIVIRKSVWRMTTTTTTMLTTNLLANSRNIRKRRNVKRRKRRKLLSTRSSKKGI